MLADSLKQDIQTAYTRLLESKGYQARHCQKLMIAEVARVLGVLEADSAEEAEEAIEEATEEATETTEADALNPAPAPAPNSDPAPAPAPAPNCGNTCIVEAGTGTGKTIAYALAAIPVALALEKKALEKKALEKKALEKKALEKKALKKKIVISTATVALQEQIVYTDLPDIRDHSKLDFSFALAKGRRRYLCLAKLDMALQNTEAMNQSLAFYDELMGEGSGGNEDASDTEVFDKLLTSFGAGKWDGDRDSWPLEVADNTWRRISTDHAQCTGRRCSHYENCCFYKAREDIHRVDCIVTNHDLVLADLMMGGGAVLPPPEDCIYIFDEGHHLPDKAASHFSHTASLYATRSWLQQLPNSLKQAASDLSLANPAAQAAQAERQVADLLPTLDLAAQMFQPFQQQGDQVDENWRYTFPLGQVPDEIRQISQDIASTTTRLCAVIDQLQTQVSNQVEDAAGDARDLNERWLAVLTTMQARLDAFQALWLSYAKQDEGAPWARWVVFQEGGGMEGMEMVLSSCPVSVAEDLVQKLWQRSFGVVITSATLSVGGDFSSFRQRTGLGAENRFVSLPSPFDFAGKARLRLPKMRHQPSEGDAHSKEIAEMLPALLEDEPGSLVLFTSWRQMRLVMEELDEGFAGRVLAQGKRSKVEIINRHKEAIDGGGQSCIFGQASFAEGIDLPGPYCTHVVIAKIPFAVPDDPVGATLAKWIESQGGNPFVEVSVPDAAIRMVQMSGRLLRTETDEGQVTVLDRRLLTKGYGKQMLNALPPFTKVFE